MGALRPVYGESGGSGELAEGLVERRAGCGADEGGGDLVLNQPGNGGSSIRRR
jgi:hypothetical protein